MIKLFDIDICCYREVKTILEVPSRATVGVFFEAAFAGVVRLGEIAVCLHRCGDFDVPSELLSIIG